MKGTFTIIQSFVLFNKQADVDLPIVQHIAADAEEAAWQAVDAAKAKVDERLARLRKVTPERHPSCGVGVHAFRDRHDPRRGFIGKFRCKRLDCQSCRQRSTVKAISHARDVLLLVDDDAGGHLPRMVAVHLWHGPWRRWEAISKAIRRCAPDGAGYARVRTGDDVVIVAEFPFPGSEGVAPAEALEQLSDAIERVATRRHAIRFLGGWEPQQQPRRWELLQAKLRPERVRVLAEELGGTVRDLPRVKGVAWRFGDAVPEERVQRFYLGLSGFRQGNSEDPEWPKLDSGPPGGAPGDTGPPDGKGVAA